MERAVAVKKLVKLLGKKFGYRIDNKAASREEREAAQEALKPAWAKRDALREKKEARFRAILAADAEYQSLYTAHLAARDEVDRLSSITRHHKITVGTCSSMFFSVVAEGDSWEDVIAKVQAKQAPAR